MSEERFASLFGEPPAATAWAPGRVNLIGEHIDYNGGVVLPAALHLGVRVSLTPRGDDRVRIASDRFPGTVETSLEGDAPQWARHALGALVFAHKGSISPAGADVFIASDLPDGAGLSSSAALIVGILKACRTASQADLSDTSLAVLARRVENEFIGLPCGIMDQIAVAIARPGEALALDTRTLDHALVTLPVRHRFIVVHSGVQRRLSDGRYAQRRAECEEAREALGVGHLCLIDDDAARRIGALAPVIGRRAQHCVSEHRRALGAIDALKAGDVARFGALMNESHASMRDDFEISLPQIDALVRDAMRLGALGARLTGGGFGGCIVALVDKMIADTWSARLVEAHPAARLIS